MNIFISLVLFPISIIMIWKGAEWLVESAIKIANHFGIPHIIIGLTIVAFGTSAPEFVVSIISAINGVGNIAVANIVGSNIINLGIILGLCAMLYPIKTEKKSIKRDFSFLLIGTIVFSLFIVDLQIGRLEGIILVSMLIFYITMLLVKKECPNTNNDSTKN